MITGSIHGTHRTELSDGRHLLIADVKKELGGADLGPDPHELLEAALAACTLITMQMYGARKSWALGKTRVGVKVLSEGERVEIGRTLHFDPSLTPEQRSKLTEIANKCPIHKLLHAPIHVTTEVV